MKRIAVFAFVLLICVAGVAIWYWQANQTVADNTPDDDAVTTEGGTVAPGTTSTAPLEDETRQKNIAMEPRYEQVKNLAWNTEDMNVLTNGNGLVLVEGIKVFDFNRVFQSTYGNVPATTVIDDFTACVGECVLFDRAVFRECLEIAADSEEAKAVNGGQAFFKLYLDDGYGNPLVVYLLSESSDTDPEYSVYLTAASGEQAYIQGWPLGLETDDTLVLGR